MLQKALKDKQRNLTKLRQQTEEKKKENNVLDKELRELQVCVLERKEIEDLAGKYVCMYPVCSLYVGNVLPFSLIVYLCVCLCVCVGGGGAATH